MTEPSSTWAPDLVVRKESPYNAETPLSPETELVTPVELFFVRNHFPVPSETPDKLSLTGEVHQILELSMQEIKSFPPSTITSTLECAGNGRAYLDPRTSGVAWEIGAVSTARWTGTLLRHLLQRARLTQAAETIVFVGADSGAVAGVPHEIAYERSLSRDDAVQDSVLVAYEMNGWPLPLDRGGPLRLIVPGWYGMASVKWLHEIRAIRGRFEGHFQTGDYVIKQGSAVTPCRETAVRSIILSPQVGARVEARDLLTIHGYAWSGRGPVESVAVSADGGLSWRNAHVESPGSPYAWQRWHIDWRPETLGDVKFLSRATDSAGRIQPIEQQWNEGGYSNNAAVPIHVTVI